MPASGCIRRAAKMNAKGLKKLGSVFALEQRLLIVIVINITLN